MANEPRPQPFAVKPEHIPAELKALPQWVIWRYFWLATRLKWDKPPLNARTGNAASSTNPNTWGTFDDAMSAYGTGLVDGIGFVVCEKNGLVGIDLDHCHTPDTGDLDAWALDLVQAIDSYTEVSPSGTGLRIWAKGTLPPGARKKGSIEMYISARYLTVTGGHLQGTPTTIEPRHADLAALHGRVFGSATKRTRTAPETRQEIGPQLDDDELIEKALRAKNSQKFAALWSGDASGYPSHSEADLALCTMLAFWTQDEAQLDRLFRRSALTRPKWERADYRQWTLEKALAEERQHWRPWMAPTASAPEGDPWDGMNTLPLRPYAGYRGLRYGKGARHG